MTDKNMRDVHDGHDDIQNIIDRVRESDGRAVRTDDGGGAVFRFGERPAAGGALVFEASGEEAPDGAAAPTAASAPDGRDEPSAPADTESAVPVSPPPAEPTEPEEETPRGRASEILPPVEEFSIPDSFDAEALQGDDAYARIFTTYLPRFTEASENYRRRQAQAVASRAGEGAVATPPPADEAVTGDSIDPVAESTPEGDPTAGAVLVETSRPATREQGADTLNVFKFAERRQEPTPPPQTEEGRARADIHALFQRDSQPEVVVAPPAPEDAADPESLTFTYEPPEAARRRSSEEHARAGVSPCELLEVDEGEHNDPRDTREYTTGAARDAFKDRFLDRLLATRVRFFACLAVAVLLFLLENVSLFGVDVAALLHLGRYPGAIAWLDMMLIACLFFIALPETSEGVRRTLRGVAQPEIFVLAGAIVQGIYCLVVALLAPAAYPLFGFAYAVTVLAAIAASYFSQRAAFLSFRVVSAKGEKRVLDCRDTRTLEAENMALDGAVQEYKSKIARTFRTNFVTDFFDRTARRTVNEGNVLVALSAGGGLALVTGIILFFLGGAGVMSALPAFTLVFTLACPAFSVLLHTLPYFYATRASAEEHGAFLGEAALDEYAGVNVLTFEDTELFSGEDVNLKRIMLYGDRGNLTKAMRQMAALFGAAGGPLDAVFSASLDKRCPPAQEVLVEAGGLSGRVDGHVVCAGDELYMEKHGMTVPSGTTDGGAATGSIRVMYAAEDGRIYARFFIRYSFSESFTSLLPLLREAGIVPLVYTRDPNVHVELMRLLTGGQDVIRVMHKETLPPQTPPVYRRMAAGLVTTDKAHTLTLLRRARAYRTLVRRMAAVELTAVAAGSVLGILLSLGGMIPAASVFFGLWQAVWCGVLWGIDARLFRRTARPEENND